MREHLYATFKTSGLATQAFCELLAKGVPSDNLSLLAQRFPLDQMSLGSAEVNSHAAQDWSSSVATGPAVRLTPTLVDEPAQVTVPGVGFVCGTGALALALARITLTNPAGAVGGAATGWLLDHGFHPDQLWQVAETVVMGGALVGVAVPTGKVATEEILRVLVQFYGTPRIISTPAQRRA